MKALKLEKVLTCINILMHIACKNYFSRLGKPRRRLGGLGLGRGRARLDPNRQDGQNWLAERDTRVGALGNLV